MNEKGCATAVLVYTPGGIPLVKDPSKLGMPVWKAPGGKSEGDETPEGCAIREIEEEVGVKLSVEQLIKIYEEDRGSHNFVAFVVYLKYVPKFKKRGDEGEEVRIFKARDILSLRRGDFFEKHRLIFKEILEIIAHR